MHIKMINKYDYLPFVRTNTFIEIIRQNELESFSIISIFKFKLAYVQRFFVFVIILQLDLM